MCINIINFCITRFKTFIFALYLVALGLIFVYFIIFRTACNKTYTFFSEHREDNIMEKEYLVVVRDLVQEEVEGLEEGKNVDKDDFE